MTVSLSRDRIGRVVLSLLGGRPGSSRVALAFLAYDRPGAA